MEIMISLFFSPQQQSVAFLSFAVLTSAQNMRRRGVINTCQPASDRHLTSDGFRIIHALAPCSQECTLIIERAMLAVIEVYCAV
jgi:hypothetical protein